MTTASTRKIEVFRPGTFVPMSGAPVTMTAEDLKAIAAAYDAEGSPTPVVVGHPLPGAEGGAGRHRPAGHRDDPTVGIVDGDVGVERPGQALDRLLEADRVAADRQHGGDEGVAPARPAGRVAVLHGVHEGRAGDRHDGEAREQRQVDLEEQRSAQRPSSRRPGSGRRRSPRRAP